MNLTLEQKWNLLLGEGNQNLPQDWQNIDEILSLLYGGSRPESNRQGKSKDEKSEEIMNTNSDANSNNDTNTNKHHKSQQQGKGKSKRGKEKEIPSISKWLGDARTYFNSEVVQVIQQDTIEKFGIEKFLISAPEVIRDLEPDVNLVSTIISLGKNLSDEVKENARWVIQKIVEQLTKKLQDYTQNTIRGSINRSIVTLRPRHNEINWHRTIRANLKHYQEQYQTIIPEKRYGFGHKRHGVKQVILCIDRSGSMGNSVVYSSIFGCVMASIPSIKTHLIMFDTEVVDLTDRIEDPVDILFDIELGGGTDINHALEYCQSKIVKPEDTILVLVSDLYEGGNQQEMFSRCKNLIENRVKLIVLLALDDNGVPSYDRYHAEALMEMGIPCFACTPSHFPDLMASAISGGIEAVNLWAKSNIFQPKKG
ncbi:MAG: VWA domain-containing protein [Bacteroidia bacterium]|nr:VWA domain-containing protein [Bacteroidia bacterium]MDW8345743.1 VWA domain-containing protein [Bacteroidia bacterium]